MTTSTAVPADLAEAARYDGRANGLAWRKIAWTYVRDRNDPPGSPSTAIADVWTPPSPMALPAEMCTRLIDYAEQHCVPIREGNHIDGTPTLMKGQTAYVVAMEKLNADAPDRNPPYSRLANRNTAPLDRDIFQAVTDRLLAANAQWWTFDVDSVGMIVKRYEAGTCHRAHIDWWPSKRELQSDKLAASIPLNDPSEWEGGEFLLRRPLGPTFDPMTLPQAQGSVTTFPFWALHEVTPIESGVRWVLLPNLYGPRPR